VPAQAHGIADCSAGLEPRAHRDRCPRRTGLTSSNDSRSQPLERLGRRLQCLAKHRWAACESNRDSPRNCFEKARVGNLAFDTPAAGASWDRGRSPRRPGVIEASPPRVRPNASRAIWTHVRFAFFLCGATPLAPPAQEDLQAASLQRVDGSRAAWKNAPATRTRGSLRAAASALAIGGLATAGHAATGASYLALVAGMSLVAAGWAVVRPPRR
jgi:hypothetical protein